VRRTAIITSCLLAAFLLPSCGKDGDGGGQTDDDTADVNTCLDPGDPIEPTDGFLQRRAEYLDACSEANAPPDGGLHGQLCRFATDAESIDDARIRQSLDKINAREDCSDFDLATLMRIVYQYGDHPLLSAELKGEIKQAILDFKYWMDEPNDDGLCFWSENHQILYHTNELLAGSLYLDEVFTNSGMTGREHAAKAEPMVERWLEWRSRFGFSEWHSNVYYVEDIVALADLADFAPNEEIRVRAAMLLDILAMDISLNSFRGIFGTSHGRTYPEKVMGARRESTRTVGWLWHGTGSMISTGDFAASHIAVSNSYVLPPILEAIGQDEGDYPFVNKERTGLTVAEAPSYGFTYDDYESITFFWGMSAYAVWQVVEGTLEMVEDYGMFEHNGFMWKQLAFLKPFVGTGVAESLTKTFDPISRGPALEQVNTYVYRTGDYQLACAQDYNKAMWGAQNHIWQATLDIDSVVFTSYPGGLEEYMATAWTGGWQPKAGQHENVVVLIYDRPDMGPLEFIFPGYTHAYFPKDSFDQWIQSGDWMFGRKGSGYVALYSASPVHWADEEPESAYELIADGRSNIWICELGSEDEWGSFESFTGAMAASSVDVDGLAVRYESPSAGVVEFSWDGPMTVDGSEVSLGPYLRFDNPYIQHEFDTTIYAVERGGSKLELDFDAPRRRFWQ